MSAYIPTNVISITDGQIFLETELFNSGIMPAVNPGISVSRVGGDAQIKAMKKVAGSLKLLYSQYRELQSFAQFGSDLDADTKSRLALGERIVAVLKQKNGSPKEVAQQVCIIYAVTHGYLTSIPVAQIPEFEKRLEEHMNNHHADVLEAIRSTGKLETETENALKAALDELVAAGNQYDLVITIGPLIMMKFVVKTCQKHGLKSIVSMNPIMIDGTGMCGGCRLTVDGKMKFTCVDGPEFDGHLVDFDEAIARSKIYEAQEQKVFERRHHYCNLQAMADAEEAAQKKEEK